MCVEIRPSSPPLLQVCLRTGLLFGGCRSFCYSAPCPPRPLLIKYKLPKTTKTGCAATYMSTWFPGVSAYIWIVLFGAILLVMNLRSVGSYGRFEFWLSMIKLATILAFVATGAALLGFGRAAPQYTAHGGFFPKGLW